MAESELSSFDAFNERNELEEDEKKLQDALETFDDDPWYDQDYSDEEEEQLLIDLDKENSLHTGDRSVSDSCDGSNSVTAFYGDVDEDNADGTLRPNIELPGESSLADQANGPEKTLALNRALQGILESYIEAIGDALQENREKQSNLEADLMGTNDPNKSTKSAHIGPFRSPYFTAFNSYPPHNEDVTLKKVSGEPLSGYIRDQVIFRKRSRMVLKKAVLEDVIEQTTRPIMIRLEAEVQRKEEICSKVEEQKTEITNLEIRIKFLTDKQKKDGELSEAQESTLKGLRESMGETIGQMEDTLEPYDEVIAKIKELDKEIQEKRSLPEEELLADLDVAKVDWMKISKMKFGGHINWLDCQKAWENLVTDQVNTKPWQKTEHEMFKKIVSSYDDDDIDWTEVAGRLGTHRTAFQCFSYYQRQLNPDLTSRKWDRKEDAKLASIAHKINAVYGFFSWKKISAMMDSRSPAECMVRFSKVDPGQCSGRWTSQEDARLIAAVELLGKRWSKISKYLGTRNMFQCRDRYVNNLEPQLNFAHFSYEEDAKLLRMIKEYGSAWAKMVPHFQGRSDGMLLTRSRTLKRWKDQKEWFDRQSKQMQDLLQGKNLNWRERKQREMKVKDILVKDMGITSEDYRKIEMDQANGIDPDLIPPRPAIHLKLTKNAMSRGIYTYKSWMKKVDVYERLVRDVKQRLEKEKMVKLKKKGTGVSLLEEEDIEGVIESAVEQEEGLDISQKKVLDVTKNQLKDIKSSLNKIFLGNHTITVHDLLKKSLGKKKTRFEKYAANLTHQLRCALRKRSQGVIASIGGRSRRFLEDGDEPLDDEEQKELDTFVPSMFVKSFGSDPESLRDLVHSFYLDAEERYIFARRDVELDEQYQNEFEALVKLISETERHQLMDAETKEKRLNMLRKKQRCLKATHRKGKASEALSAEAACKRSLTDLNFINSFVKTQDSTENNASVGAAETPIGKEAGAPEGDGSTSRTQNQDMNIDGVGGKESSNNEEIQGGSSSEVSKKRKRKTRADSLTVRRNGVQFECQTSVRTKAEIDADRAKLKFPEKKKVNNLPNIPPCISTIAALRTLLMVRKSLVIKAGDLFNEGKEKQEMREVKEDKKADVQPSNKKKKEKRSSFEMEEESLLMTSLDTDLSQQAKKYSGFTGRMKKRKAEILDELFSEVERDKRVPGHVFHHEFDMPPIAPILKAKALKDKDNDKDSNRGTDEVTQEKEAASVAARAEFPSTNKPVELPEPEVSKTKKEVITDTSGSYQVVLKHIVPLGKMRNKPVEPEKSVEPKKSRLEKSVKRTYSRNRKDEEGVIIIKKRKEEEKDDVIIDESRSQRVIMDIESGSANITVKNNSSSPVNNNSGIPVNSNSGMPVNSNSAMPVNDNSSVPVNDNSGMPVNDNNSNVSKKKKVVFSPEVVQADTLKQEQKDIKPEIRWSSKPQLMSDVDNTDADAKRKAAEELLEKSVRELASHVNKGKVEQKQVKQEISVASIPYDDVSVKKIQQQIKGIRPHEIPKVVVVGLDTQKKKVLHYKAADKTVFKVTELRRSKDVEKQHVTFEEAVPEATAESSLVHEQKILKFGAYINDLRKTDEYQLCLARFKSLFTWPSLLSTVEPPKQPVRHSKKKRPEKKAYSIKLQEKKEKLSVKQKRAIKQVAVEKRHLTKKRNKCEKLGLPFDNEKEKQNYRWKFASLKNAAESKPKRLRASNKSKYKGTAPTRRSVRTKKSEEQEVESEKEELKEEVKEECTAEPSTSGPPQWWKDAILAAMVSKKTAEDKGAEEEEVPIDEDDDFVDKGNYSDDDDCEIEMNNAEEEKE